MRSIREAELKGKKILMRVDFNVPMDKNLEIIDDTKMQAALPTIEYILSQGGRLILMSHLGRPKGKPEEQYSLKKVALRLATLINKKVSIAPDCIGPETRAMADKLQPGEVLLLENVRFYPGEEKNDPEFSKQLASLGDIFVNDAFGSAHRAHSSTAGIADFIPSYAGFLMEKEVEMLENVLEHPESPRMAILGGAKVSDKLGLIANLLDKMDIILIGGGMANTFLKAQGKNIGKSIYEKDLVEEARQLLDKAQAKNVQLMLPQDVVVAEEIKAEAACQTVSVDNVPEGTMILDIGPRTIELFTQAVKKARTIVWNGPVGVYEYKNFARGTEEITRAIASSSAVSVIGGGDSAVVAHNLGLESQITHISTGGGATLEFLEGLKLPGVQACEDRRSSAISAGSQEARIPQGAGV
ncbi:MAG: phosphoglycerate kinase [Syntrophomonas sp.]